MEWVDRVVGLENVRSELVYARVPIGQTGIELVKFHSPVDECGVQPVPTNTLAIRQLSIVVVDIDATVGRLKKRGTELFSEEHTYEDVYKSCYIRGPEGIIIELAEKIG